MPTTKPRHAITESEAISHALAVARRRWPGEPTSRLLAHLIEEGASTVEQQGSALDREHERAVDDLALLATHYPDGYLDDVRAGWDE
ncbi:hypothetical protein [Isoptericola aurantiacus]|uniref:hypothetical protein n=1 Tax=Isoptericola aurantiacus TaxID=3377839 RepID=UPI00383BF189